MRIDKFLNTVNIVKRRAVACDMLNEKIISINGIVCKKAKDVKVGDIIKIQYLSYANSYKILQIPTTKSTPRSKQEEYICQIKQD
jgi:ribosomal 50S subunit-recycling heat shock protein